MKIPAKFKQRVDLQVLLKTNINTDLALIKLNQQAAYGSSIIWDDYWIDQ